MIMLRVHIVSSVDTRLGRRTSPQSILHLRSSCCDSSCAFHPVVCQHVCRRIGTIPLLQRAAYNTCSFILQASPLQALCKKAREHYCLNVKIWNSIIQIERGTCWGRWWWQTQLRCTPCHTGGSRVCKLPWERPRHPNTTNPRWGWPSWRGAIPRC